MRGRKPVPTALKKLRGNPGRRPLNDREPQPPAKAPSCPSWLSKAAKVEWRRVVKELLALGLVTELDRSALAAYCQAVAELEWATETLDKEGRIGDGPRPHPAVRLQRDAFARVKAFLAEFGLTPASRTRLKAPEKPVGPDPLAELLSRAQGRN